MSERLEAAPDTLLAGRYRLQRAVAHGPATTLWRGLDEVLARPVAVKVLDAPDKLPSGTAAFLDAAVAAGRLTHPRIASVFDAAAEGGLTYVVSEWVDGSPLVAVLRDGPLPATRATTIAAQVAETVAYAHSRGVTHGDLDAHAVLVQADGSVKVTDFELGAACGELPPELRGLPAETRDTKAVAALLYACLTGRSVYGAEPELALAPRREGRLLSARQVRAGVPRDVDAVVVRTLLPDLVRKTAPITTPAELLAALAALPGDGGPVSGALLPPDDPAPPRRWLRLGVPLTAVAGVAVTGVLAGLAVGRVPGTVQRLPGLGSSVAPSESAAAGAPLVPVSVRDFDPQGDGEENHNEVALAYNNDPSNAWHTTTYFSSATFGNLKSGVGLLVDLGREVRVDHAVIAFAQPGESVELRAAAAPSADVAGYPVVAGATDVKVPVTLRPGTPTTARYWVIWITRLVPQANGKFSAGIAEFGLFASA